MVMAEWATRQRTAARVFAFIRWHHAEVGMAPTMREIADGCVRAAISGRRRQGSREPVCRSLMGRV